MKKVLTILFGPIVLSGFAGTLYFLYSKSETPPVRFATEQAAVTTIIKKTVATGSVVPRKEVEIKPQVSGIVEKIYVEPGVEVERGALIARITIIPNMVSLNNAENRVNQARIAMDNAEIDLTRARRLLEEGVVSQVDFQQDELDYQNAREELTAATNNLQLIRKGTLAKSRETSNTLVRATIAGMVLQVPLEEGDSVIESNTFNDGTTIATIADMNEPIFEGKVDESEVGKIRPGMELMLTIGAIEGESFDAELEHIAPKGVEENGAIQFEIRAAMKLRDDQFVRANYSANADIVLDRRDEAPAINEALLQLEDDETFVEVETTEQAFEKRVIETGLSDGINIEVISGLSLEDRIKNPNKTP